MTDRNWPQPAEVRSDGKIVFRFLTSKRVRNARYIAMAAKSPRTAYVKIRKQAEGIAKELWTKNAGGSVNWAAEKILDALTHDESTLPNHSTIRRWITKTRPR